MNQSNKLFELIHSLSKSEKRHFKLSYQNISSNKNYIKLFDAIIQQTKFDDYALKRKFEGETFVKQFNVSKLYLYDLITNSLVKYNEEKNIELQCKTYLQKAIILIDKTFYQQAVLQILKAKKLAEEYELYLESYQCINLLKRLFTTRISLDKWNYDLIRLKEEENSILEKLRLYNLFNNIQADTSNFLRHTPFITSEVQKTAINKIIQPIINTDINSIKSYSIKIVYYNIMVNYYHFINDLGKTKQFTLLRYQCLKEAKYKITDAKRKETGYLANHIHACLNIQAYDEAKIWIDELKQILIRDKKLLFNTSYFKRFTVAYNMLINYYIETGKFKEGLQFSEPIIINFDSITLSSFDDKVHYIAILHSTTMLYFGANNLDKALTWNNKILNQNVKSTNTYYGLAQILNILIHFDLQNYRYVEQIIPSTQKALRRNKLYTNAEKILLSGLGKLAKNVQNPEKFKTILKNTQKSLNEIETHPLKLNLLLYYDIDAWLSSKIKKVSVEKIIQTKAKKKTA